MSKLTFPNLNTLVPDMVNKNVSKEHFSFNYANQRLDCIFSFSNARYELLVGIHALNYGFVANIYQNAHNSYVAEITDSVYQDFCNVLNLSYRGDGFTSNTLLNLLSVHVPVVSQGVEINYEVMHQYTKCRQVDEADKIYFKGWNDHIKDGNEAHNFDKTEFYFGSEVANYCRQHNISSLWTSVSRERKEYRQPWQRN
jgi:hypothetical protein